ncbi:MAG: hypothetical protein AB7U95_27990 [Reyranella sp.]
MTIETMRCPKCGHDCGFDPSSGDVWCPTEGGGCGYQYSPDPATCEFCGAPMRPGDKRGECGHVEGQGGAAAVLTPAPRYCFCGKPGRAYPAALPGYPDHVSVLCDYHVAN